MNVNFNGYGENVLTFIADSSLTETGVPVKVIDDGTVAKCGGNENFCGICVGLRDGYAAVQLAGYVRAKAAAKIAAGYKKLAAGSTGDVATNVSGREYLVVDSTSTEIGFIL
ncbi:MAG: hypothetical protein IIZ23_03830 [Ruminococcus sp.]|jgi:hypothetical protein|nr:hypothetical protein [Ruminococcus sp.]